MICPFCGCENPDDYKFCHDCGNPLIRRETINEDLEIYPNFDTKKLIIIGYIIAILFGWGSFLLSFLFGSYGFIGFIGLFFPGFMLNSKDPNIRKHAYIQMAIMILGIIVTFLVLFR
ncbi:zinc ribbon domain-containing protein [uncultured Methanobrevibacter sp.]|uniref:zinc ribbon domain-containing protein n=1 Tax=uncultured Methanobrevibacter sp. TaxID=253161 RepID=UPI002632D96D